MTLIEAVSMTVQADWNPRRAQKTFRESPQTTGDQGHRAGDLKLATAYLHHLSVDHDDLVRLSPLSNTNEH